MYNNLYNDTDFEMLFDNHFSGGFAFLFLFLLFFLVAIIVISCIADWKLFKKAGKKGWEALIPFYNNWVRIEISGLNWWWFLLLLAPNIILFANEDLSDIASLVSIFASFNCFYNIAKKFKKDTGTSVCAGIFSFIFVCIFAFSNKEQYYSDVEVSNNGVFPNSGNSSDNKDNEKTKTNNNHCSNCGNKMDDDYKFCPNCGKENK